MTGEQINRRFPDARQRLSWTGEDLACEISMRGPRELTKADVLTAVNDLIEAGCMRKTSVVETPSGSLILRWDKVGKLTYSWEWPTEGWRAAAHVALRALEVLKRRSLTLHRLHPYDVFMAGSTPMIANLGTLARWSPERQAASLAQIDCHFIRPLAFAAQGHARLARRLMCGSPDGISAQEAAVVLGPERPHRSLRDAFGWLEELKISSHDDFWKRYRQRACPAEVAAKTAVVDHVLRCERPMSVLDIGCNTGRFTQLASASGATVVGVDSDEACMDTLFMQASSARKLISGVVMSLSDPSGSRGWGDGWCAPAERRLASELVLVLAILHHLALSMRMPADELRHLLSSLSTRWLLLEFVPVKSGDAYATLRPTGSYSIDWILGLLSDRFVERQRWHYGPRGRALLLLERAVG